MDALIRDAIAGDQAAWTELVRSLLPRIQSIIGSHPSLRSRGLANLKDDVSEVTTAALERLSRDGMRNLTLYLAQAEQQESRRPQSFDSWLYGAVDFTVRDHLRQRYGRAPKPSPDALSSYEPSKRDFGTGAAPFDEEHFRNSVMHGIGLTTNLTLMEILSYVDANFEPLESRALRLHYFDEQSFAEIAQALELPDASAAEKLVRKLNARLRYRFTSQS